MNNSVEIKEEILDEKKDVPVKRSRGRPRIEKKEDEEPKKKVYPSRDEILNKKIAAIVRAELEILKKINIS
jgi:hypothetical protein